MLDQVLFALWSLGLLFGLITSGLINEFPLLGVQVSLSGALIIVTRQSTLTRLIMGQRIGLPNSRPRWILVVLIPSLVSILYAGYMVGQGIPVILPALLSLSLILSLIFEAMRLFLRTQGLISFSIYASVVWIVVSFIPVVLLTLDRISLGSYLVAYVAAGVIALLVLLKGLRSRIPGRLPSISGEPENDSKQLRRLNFLLPILLVQQGLVVLANQLIATHGPSQALAIILSVQLLTGPSYLFAQALRTSGLTGQMNTIHLPTAVIFGIILMFAYLLSIFLLYPWIGLWLDLPFTVSLLIVGVGLISLLQIGNGALSTLLLHKFRAVAASSAGLAASCVRLLATFVLLYLNAEVDLYALIMIPGLVTAVLWSTMILRFGRFEGLRIPSR